MNNQNNSLSSSLLEIITDLCRETHAFYNKINSSDDSVFYNNKEFAQRYKKEYNNFSVILANHIFKCEEYVFSLTLLIKKSDKENNAEETIRLSAEFEKYVRFSAGISDFIKRNEAVIKENYDLNKNEIIVLIQNLLTSIQNYKEELQPNA